MKRSEPSQGLVSACYFLLIFLGYALVIRISNFISLTRLQDVSIGPFGPPFSLPFILGEELIVGAVLALVLFLLWRVAMLRYLWICVLGGYLFFLAFEQTAFKSFLGHVDYLHYTSSHDVPRLWSSIEGSFDFFFVLHLVLAFASVAALALRFRPRFIIALSRAVATRTIRTAVFLVVYGGINLALVLLADQHGLNRSFPLNYAASYIQVRAEEQEIERALAARPAAAPRKKPERAVPKTTEETSAKKLNVVWYLMESASWRETSLNPDNEYDTTPFLKELAPQSLLFPNYYTGFAASTRAFFSALTGLYPYVDSSADVTKYSRLGVPNLVDILHEEGYSTGFFSSSDTLFDSLDTLLTNLEYDTYLDKNLVPKEALENVATGSWGVDEEIVIDKALEWIEQVKDAGKPFYLNYNAVYPHHPFRVPKQHRGLFDMEWGDEELKARYRASLYYADMSVRRFYDGLKRMDLLEDTLFIVTSDHGEAFGDVHKNNRIHAEFCYNEDYQIFLMLHNLKALGSPKKDTRPGTHADLLPTLLEILGIGRDLETDGQSLVSDDYKVPIVYCASRRQIGVRDGNYKLVTPKTGGKSELYDISSDPEEQNDISRQNRDLVEKYEKMVKDWRISVIADYRERVRQAGLSEDEIQDLAKKRRNEIFAGTRARINSASVCLQGSCGGTFPAGRELAVNVKVRKPGNVALQVDVFDPSGTRIAKHKTPHQSVASSISTTLPANLFQKPGRYRARILLLSSHAVHDSTARYFNIAP